MDELNAFVGAARATVEELAASQAALAPLGPILLRVQHELFNLGSILATLPEDVHPRQARVTEAEVARLRREVAEARSEARAAVEQVHRQYRRDLVPLDMSPVRWFPSR